MEVETLKVAQVSPSNAFERSRMEAVKKQGRFRLFLFITLRGCLCE